MGFWKVLGGVAAGVGIVAAAPVFGAVGTITAVGAAVGAAAGAVGGAVASSLDEDEVIEASNRGYERGKAENLKEIEKLQQALAHASERFTEHKEYENLVVAMFAVGIAVANCDGYCDPREQEDIDAFIAGEAFIGLPQTVQNYIQKLYQQPPTFNQAMKYVEVVDKADWRIFDNVINLVMKSDEVEQPEELAFKEAWRRFKAS